MEMRVGIFNQRRDLDKIQDLYMCLQSRLQEPGYKAGKRSIARNKKFFWNSNEVRFRNCTWRGKITNIA